MRYRDVDLAWHMHEVSDGERRRVQIVSGLMAPWQMLLLDEVRPSLFPSSDPCSLLLPQVTVDLDVLVRSRLLAFLVEECETRGATLLYATHIFDGLDAFPTHLCHIQLGRTIAPSPMSWPVLEEDKGLPQGVWKRMQDPQRPGSKLLELALAWLVEDKEARVNKEVARDGVQKRGAQAIPTDSEAFYRK